MGPQLLRSKNDKSIGKINDDSSMVPNNRSRKIDNYEIHVKMNTTLMKMGSTLE